MRRVDFRVPQLLTRAPLAASAMLAVALVAGCAADEGAEADDAMYVRASSEASSTGELEPVASQRLCITDGRLDRLDPTTLSVDVGRMRGFVAGDASRSAELAFSYPGPSRDEERLANGELRRQIGLKLRAKDTCNVVYVMWHIEPTSRIVVQVKSNPGASTHAQCGDAGYLAVHPAAGTAPPAIQPGEKHVLRADLDGDLLTVMADGMLAWQGRLPAEASVIDGPAGIRSDNGHFDFELRVPGGARTGAVCDVGQAAR